MKLDLSAPECCTSPSVAVRVPHIDVPACCGRGMAKYIVDGVLVMPDPADAEVTLCVATDARALTISTIRTPEHPWSQDVPAHVVHRHAWPKFKDDDDQRVLHLSKEGTWVRKRDGGVARYPVIELDQADPPVPPVGRVMPPPEVISNPDEYVPVSVNLTLFGAAFSAISGDPNYAGGTVIFLHRGNTKPAVIVASDGVAVVMPLNFAAGEERSEIISQAIAKYTHLRDAVSGVGVNASGQEPNP
jgi:hypothetical protein